MKKENTPLEDDGSNSLTDAEAGHCYEVYGRGVARLNLEKACECPKFVRRLKEVAKKISEEDI